jgi:hypothetical protein
VHGSAPDIAGKGLANPIAMIASFGMALRYSFDMGALADKIDAAIAAVLASGLRTADIKSIGIRRRERVVLELAVARQNFGAGIEPGARGDVDAGARTLLVGAVGALCGRNRAAVLVILRLGLARWAHAEPTATRAAAASNTTSLLAAGNFRVIASSSLPPLTGWRIAKSDWRSHCSRPWRSSLGQLRHTGPE